MGYRIVTDSTTDLTQKMIGELELTVISLRFTIDGKTYRDKPDQSEMPTKTFTQSCATAKCPRPRRSTRRNLPPCSSRF